MEEAKQQNQIETPEAKSSVNDDLVGIKGWLILVAIGVVLSPFRVFIESVNTFKPIFTTEMWQRLTSQFGDMYHPLWEPLLIIEMVFNAALFLASLYLIVLFFKHKKAFVSWYLAILFGGLAFIALHDGEWQQNSDSLFKQRFQISSQTFWRTGRNFELLTFFSIEQQLRDNEQLVWQRLIRVLNHEVRNSLTPIYSMSQSLQTLKRQGQISSHDDLAQDMLQVIEKRAQHLLDFVASYSAFAKLPPAQKQAISSEQLNTRLSAIFPELVINSSEELHINADFGQLEQALINLIKNAFEAGSNSAPTLTWSRQGDSLNIAISDQGCGIQNPDNLFVPFYSTKANGTGIGLVITRELVRNQGFELSINSKPQQGTEANITVSI